MSQPENPRIDRRVAIKWMLTAGAGAMLARVPSFGADTPAPAPAAGSAGYGKDPDLMKPYRPGDYWPLILTGAQRRAASALCDVVVPADEVSPSASSVGVPDFIDEWVSAPYPANVADRPTITDGLDWLDAESARRFGAPFADAAEAQRVALCEEISHGSGDKPDPKSPSAFFRRFRNLTTAGFYTTPVGMKDLGYVGNVPLARFDGPPADLIAKLGLTDEVEW